MEQRGIFIYNRLFVVDIVLLSYSKVGDSLPAERDQTGNTVGIDTVNCKILFIQSNHHGQISSGRMPRYKYSRTVASISSDILKDPCHRCCRIFNISGCFYPRGKPIVDADNAQTFIFQCFGKFFIASCQAATVKPDDCSEIFFIYRIVNIEQAPLSNIAVLPAHFFRIIGNVGNGFVSYLLCYQRCG
ncbi:hypothetical protein SDC9_165299 [bioreactor metagenome]|uniref:Uncharacterized protein n=1 Tax=bioreactor metagenome TaxID=1076179 RepID=A0A645FTZ1_9ZZZZ